MLITVCAAQLSDLPQLAKMNSRLVDDQGSENPFSLKEYEGPLSRVVRYQYMDGRCIST